MRFLSVLCLVFLIVSFPECKEVSWISTPSEKVDVMDVDSYEVVMLDPIYNARVFSFREREKLPIAYLDLKGGDIEDPLFLKMLIEERIPEILFQRFLGICFVNPPANQTKSGVIQLFKCAHYQYPEMKIIAVYNPETIREISPYISYAVTAAEFVSFVEEVGLIPLRLEDSVEYPKNLKVML